jgi:hypothetical protein
MGIVATRLMELEPKKNPWRESLGTGTLALSQNFLAAASRTIIWDSLVARQKVV